MASADLSNLSFGRISGSLMLLGDCICLDAIKTFMDFHAKSWLSAGTP